MIGVFLAGRAGSGKSPLARHIVGEFEAAGRYAEVASFADEVKREVWETYGIKKGDLGSRELLIAHAEGKRQLDPTYWVRRLIPKLDYLYASGAVPVIDDVRRLPEYQFLCDAGYLRVRVMAPINRRRAALSKAGLDPGFADSTHSTEIDHEVWQYDIRRVLLHDSLDFFDAAKDIVRAFQSG